MQKEATVFSKKGTKRAHSVGKEHGESVTVVACGSATGFVIPAMLFLVE